MVILMRIVTVIALLAGLFVAGVVWRSEAHLRSFAPATASTAAIPNDSASLARGRHIAMTRGCTGCHGTRLEGEVFQDDPWYAYGRWVAPNLARLARAESPAVIEAAVRQGIGHDGRALFAMPSYNFANLRDDDLAAVIGYLRSVPVVDRPLPAEALGWKARWDMARGSDWAVPHYVAETPLLRHQSDPDPAVRRGEYLAMTSCNECHGFGLRGDNPFDPPDHRPPDLAGARGYAKADFVRLMRTGLPPGGRDLGLMKEVARSRFVHWTPQEVDDLYAFLTALGS